MFRFAILCFLASCVGTANSNCDTCGDHLNEKCRMIDCRVDLGSGSSKENKVDQDPPNNERSIVGNKNEEVSQCDTTQCENSSSIESGYEGIQGFKFDSSQAESSEVLLILNTPNSISDLTLQEWRQKTECLNCSERKKIDLLTLRPSAGAQGIDWDKIEDLIEDTYGSSISLQILVFPALHESFLDALDGMLDDMKGLQRVIFLDPGVHDGLNGVLSMVNAAAKLKKRREADAHFPSLEVLALNTGRTFEKDRRRILTGNAHFFYVELAVSETLGAGFLVDWFIESRLGINGPLIYGKASKLDIVKIRNLTPAAWFQRTSGSKTEDVSDDTLTLMLP